MLVWHHEDHQNSLHDPRSLSLSSVTQGAQAMRTMFRPAQAIARQTGFVQRESHLTGDRGVQTLVTAWLHNPQASREAEAEMAASLGVALRRESRE